MEKPYTGLTALVKVNSTTIGYINNVELNLEKEVVEILQFGAQYQEKVPTIKNWTASSEGTVAFASGEGQEKLYLAFESGEPVTLEIKLDTSVGFTGTAYISSLSVSGAPNEAMSISVEFEGSGAITFNLPQTVNVMVSSSVGGTTDPAGSIRLTKGSTLTVACIPSPGKTATSYKINNGSAVNITGNSFTTAAISADSTIVVTFA